MAAARSRSGAPPKKHTLTLAQIASYDDILTDALVDHAFYWTTIPKNRPSYLPSRGVKEEEITKIIQNHLIVDPDLQVAEEKLLATNGLGKFYKALKSDFEKDDFRRHLRRYMQIYLPDCPFEVAATNRYTIFQEEASICARRFIRNNETIKYLAGIQVVITPEEEAQLSERKKDFSIVVSSRKKEVNLFMGPARFANHDCDANARLVTTGQAGIEIIATRSIGVGEEITVTYGDSYFGEDNCECLCRTCETNVANGWAPADGQVPVKQSVEDGAHTPVQGYSLRRRDEHSFNRGHSETPSLTAIARPKVSKASLRKLVRTAEATPATEDSVAASPMRDASAPARGQKRDRDSLLATPPVTPAKRQKTAAGDAVLRSGRGQGSPEKMGEAKTSTLAVLHSPTPRRPSFADSIHVFQQDAEEESEPVRDPMPTPEASQQLAESDGCDSEVGDSIVVATGTLMMETSTNLKVEETCPVDVLTLPTPESGMESEEEEKRSKAMEEEGSDSVPTTASSTLPAPRRGRPRKIRRTPVAANKARSQKEAQKEQEEGVEQGDSEESGPPPRRRVPGDYTLTPLLLSEPETAWVICSVCSKAFVQHDAYFTRMSCPRCERHSKLYGYMWPKTEPEGKWDKEERILDHRLVHRFLHAGDEAKIRGRKQAAWQRDEAAAEEDEEERGRQTSRAASGEASGKSSAGSGIWRKLRYTIAKEREEQASKSGKAKTATTAVRKAVRATQTTKTMKMQMPKTSKTSQTAKEGTASDKAEKPGRATGRATKTAAAAESAQPPAAVRTGRTTRTVRAAITAKAFYGPREGGRMRKTAARVGAKAA